MNTDSTLLGESRRSEEKGRGEIFMAGKTRASRKQPPIEMTVFLFEYSTGRGDAKKKMAGLGSEKTFYALAGRSENGKTNNSWVCVRH